MTDKRAFLFPGQGSQSVGMGESFLATANGRQRVKEASDALGVDMRALILDGPSDKLNLTPNTQPALFVVSAIAFEALRDQAPEISPTVVAGHSLGEFSACFAAGAISFADGVRLVRRRGELMQSAVPVGEGGMAAIIGLTGEQVESALNDFDGEVSAANFNSPEQTVVAGKTGDIEKLLPYMKEKGAKKAIPLTVSAPFHTEFMRPAREGLAFMLSSITINDPLCPVIRNVDAGASRTAEEVKDGLIEQVTGCVRWVDSIRRLPDFAVDSALEVGPGKVLAGLMRRIDKSISVTSVSSVDDISKLLEKING